MRRRLVPAALAASALALAALAVPGCRVDVDGAPCAGPGTTADCPDGQACGNDLRCSARALACAGSRCTPGRGYCAGVAAVVCTGADPVCGQFVVDDCASRALECGTRRGADLGACECPPADPGTVLVADPGGSPSAGAFPYPNGQAWPRECRFGRLGDALTAAAERSPDAITVRVEAEGPGTIAFGEETAESWPLFVSSNVSVAGAAAAGPTLIHGTSGAPAILSVEGSVEDVRVDAEGATTAVRVTAPGARLVRVEVSGAAGAALQIEVDPNAATTVEVLGGSYGASRVGIWIRGGRVMVAPDPEAATTAVAAENPGSTIVPRNLGDGVVIGGIAGRGLPLAQKTVEVVLEGILVDANEGTGIVVAGLPSASRISISKCDVHANGVVDPITYGPVGETRIVGGILVSVSQMPGFAFHRNRLWSNAADQVAFDSGWDGWTIAASGCGPETNVFGCAWEVSEFACIPQPICIDGGSCVIAVVGLGSVDAKFNAWPFDLSGRDHATPSKVTNVDSATSCASGKLGAPTAPAYR